MTRVSTLMKERFVEGSDPGLAVARTGDITPAAHLFGFDAKKMVVTQDQARTIAKNAGIPLVGLGGTEGGVIGALAGVALAASGSDGRFLSIGTIREFPGPRTIEKIHAAGIPEVHTLDGERIYEGFVEMPKFPQPVCIRGQPVLFVERDGSGLRSVKRD